MWPVTPAPAAEGLNERTGRDEEQWQEQVTLSKSLCLKGNREIGLKVTVGWTEGSAKMGRITASLRAGGFDPLEKETLMMQASTLEQGQLVDSQIHGDGFI